MQKFKMSKKDMMILAGASLISMAAGVVVGMMKEKMMVFHILMMSI